MIVIRMAMLFWLLAASSACAPGIIYTDNTLPLSTNFDRTPLGIKRTEATTRQVRLPIPRARISAEWYDEAIGEAANKAGLEEIYYVDINTFSILAGTFSKKTLLIWGR